MGAKAWAERLPLSDLRGFLLFGCALRLNIKGCLEIQEKHDSFLEGWAGISRRASNLGASLDVVNDVLSFYSDSLPSQEAAERAEIGDFIIFADQLFVRQALAFFVVPSSSRQFCKVDGETPIARNFELPLGELESLFRYWADYFLGERLVLPEDVSGWPSKAEHFHWLNYVAPHCEPPREAHRPKGSGYRDGTRAAALYACGLHLEGEESGKPISKTEAVNRALKLWPHKTIQDAPTSEREREGVVIAPNDTGAFKRVYKQVDFELQKGLPSLDADFAR